MKQKLVLIVILLGIHRFAFGQNETIQPANTGNVSQLAILGQGPINDIEWIGNSNSIAIVTRIGIWLYDIENPTSPQYIEADGYVETITISPDGKFLAFRVRDSNYEQSLELWDLDSLKRIEMPSHNIEYISILKFSPDSSQLLVNTYGTAYVFDLDRYESGVTEILKIPTDKRLVDVSPDWTLGVSPIDNTQSGWLQTIDWVNGVTTDKYQIGGHHDFIDLVGFSSNNTLVATASSRSKGEIFIWDIDTGRRLAGIYTTAGINGPLTQTMTMSDDGQFIATEFAETVQLWSVAKAIENETLEQGDETYTLQGHTDDIKLLAFNTDGQYLASASYDHSIKIWDVATGKEQFSIELTGTESFPTHFAFDSQGQYLYVAHPQVQVWNIDSAISSVLPNPERQLFNVNFSIAPGVREPNMALSPDDSTVAIAWLEDFVHRPIGTIQLWDVKTDRLILTLQEKRRNIDNFYYQPIWSLVYSPDGGFIAQTDFRLVNIWDAETGRQLAELRGHNGYVDALAFSSDSQILASGSSDKTIALWDMRDFSLIGTLSSDVEESHFAALAFSPDNQILASAHDNTICFWDMAIRTCGTILQGHEEQILSLAFNSDGTVLASSGEDSTIKLWDVETAELLQTLEGHIFSTTSIAFSPLGNILASTGLDGTVRIWGVANE